jgi:hypothetical protein
MENKLTIEQHKQIADKLKQQHVDLNQMLIAVSRMYGTSAKETKAIETHKISLSKFRSIMDSRVIKENSEMNLKDISFYFSGDIK